MTAKAFAAIFIRQKSQKKVLVVSTKRATHLSASAGIERNIKTR
jgi:hypothetical protein